MNVLLGVTGSVALINTGKLIVALQKAGHDVQLVYTKSARELGIWKAISAGHGQQPFKYYGDINDPWDKIGDSILHIELRNWADALIIAPLSANTLAKLANGFCDNLLTEVVRAWDYGKPLIVAPAMNTMMWENEPTSEHIDILTNRGIEVISPVVKTLACGDTGMGAMCSHDTIVSCLDSLRWSKPLDNFGFVPEAPHPGSFGYKRYNYMHSGVDLYCKDGDPVYAVEDGDIVNWGPFTGPQVGTPHWENTDFVAIRGKSGIIVYGEVEAVRRVESMAPVYRGEHIANVKRVIPLDKARPDIPHHSTSMVHFELYRHDAYDDEHPRIYRPPFVPVDWKQDIPKPRVLLDPTSRLKNVKIF